VPSPLNITNIPAPRTPLTDPVTGLLSREWYRFFLNLFDLTGGGGSPTSISDLLVVPQPELGSIASQNSDNVSITGGTIDNTPIGNTTTSSGKFTTLNATGGIGGGTF
jgi:hypothetical protein